MFFVFIVPFHFFYFARGVALAQRCIAFISYGEVTKSLQVFVAKHYNYRSFDPFFIFGVEGLNRSCVGHFAARSSRCST